MKKTIAAVLIIIGLIAGPAYLVYCLFFSGNTIGEYVIFEQNVSRAEAMGVRLTSTKNTKWKIPVKVHLSPKMNPIRIAATIRYFPPTGTMLKSTQYVAELKNGNSDGTSRLHHDLISSPPLLSLRVILNIK